MQLKRNPAVVALTVLVLSATAGIPGQAALPTVEPFGGGVCVYPGNEIHIEGSPLHLEPVPAVSGTNDGYRNRVAPLFEAGYFDWMSSTQQVQVYRLVGLAERGDCQLSTPAGCQGAREFKTSTGALDPLPFGCPNLISVSAPSERPFIRLGHCDGVASAQFVTESLTAAAGGLPADFFPLTPQRGSFVLGLETFHCEQMQTVTDPKGSSSGHLLLAYGRVMPENASWDAAGTPDYLVYKVLSDVPGMVGAFGAAGFDAAYATVSYAPTPVGGTWHWMSDGTQVRIDVAQALRPGTLIDLAWQFDRNLWTTLTTGGYARMHGPYEDLVRNEGSPVTGVITPVGLGMYSTILQAHGLVAVPFVGHDVHEADWALELDAERYG